MRVVRALEIIGPLPPTQAGRYGALNTAGEKGQKALDALDSEFFAYPDNLTEKLFEFVRNHPEAFGPVPSV